MIEGGRGGAQDLNLQKVALTGSLPSVLSYRLEDFEMKEGSEEEPLERIPRILAAEDDTVTGELLQKVLRLHGMDVDLALNGEEAVKKWEMGGYDLILMDVQMPLMDGLAASRYIREKEVSRGGHIPIIAMSGCTGEEDNSACSSAGMDACLCKPVDFSEGMVVIKALLKRSLSD